MLHNLMTRCGATVAILALSFGNASAVSAQTISQTMDDTRPPPVVTGQGQSFTATVTGNLTQIQVRPQSNGSTTLRFYNGAGSGVAGGIGVPISSQRADFTDLGSPTAGLTTFVLQTPLPIIAGSTYSFVFDQGAFAFQGTDVYAGGNLIFSNDNEFSDADLAFTATEISGSGSTPAAIPTMSEWAMIFFGLTIAGGAAFYIHRRRMTV